MKLEEALESFLLSLEAQGRSAATVKTYRVRLAPFVGQYGGERNVETIGPAEVDRWVVAQRRQKLRYEEHPTRPTLNSGLAKATVGGRVQAIKTFFRFCELRGLVGRSPAAHLAQDRYNPSSVMRAMNPADLRRMLKEAKQRAEQGNPRDLAILSLFADTGARLGEIANIRLGNIDLRELEIYLEEGKTGEGVVDFTPKTATALKAWLAVRPKCDHDYLFVDSRSWNPQRLTEPGIYQVFKRIAKKAGVDGRFNPHSVRHLVGQTWTDNDDTNLVLVQKKLRHKNIKTTADHYANQDRGRVKRATQRLSLLNNEEED